MNVAKELLSTKKVVFLDLDGVVYMGEHAIMGAAEFIAQLRTKNINVRFLTNNSGTEPGSIVKKLARMKIDAAREEVVTSGYAAALWASEQQLSSVYVSGSFDLKSMFEERGIHLTNSSASASAIVVGANKNFGYQTICDALPGLLNGATFIACNRDSYFPAGPTLFLPGCGAMVGAMEGACGRKVDFVIGKPNPYMLKLASKQLIQQPENYIMIGDSFESDIAMANEFGIDSILIGSGLTGRKKGAASAMVESIKDLL